MSDHADSAHLLLQGLQQTLPLPGEEWPPERRRKWLSAARAIIELIGGDMAADEQPQPQGSDAGPLASKSHDEKGTKSQAGEVR